MTSKRRVLLVDDHPVVRVGVRLLLENSEMFEICGEADSAPSARAQAEKLLPDLIVLDLRLGGRDGIELVEDLQAAHPAAHILIFSSLDESAYARRSLRAGARGFVAKVKGLEVLETALQKINRGEYAFSDLVHQSMLADAAGTKKGNALDELSNREMQIFCLIGEGRSTAEIAADLNLGMKTIGTYRERLKNKLNLQSAQNLEQSARDYIRQGTSRV